MMETIDRVEKDWSEFWRKIVSKEDGSIDISKVKKELSDYHTLLEIVPRVYDHVTGSRVSKPFTSPQVVCQEADEHYREHFESLHSVEQAVSVEVSGLEEYDKLLALVRTILVMTDDESIKSFIASELGLQNSERVVPVTHTFDLLTVAARAEDIELQFTDEQQAHIDLALSHLDDARKIAIEDSPEYATLSRVIENVDLAVGRERDDLDYPLVRDVQ